MKKVLIIIPARGGSKGIPQKNLKFLGNKPLIYYSIKTAQRFKRVYKNTDIFVSTENKQIEIVAQMYGVSVIPRPYNLAKDNIGLDEVVLHALEYLEGKGKSYEIIITLQPTSPLLKFHSLQKAFEQFLEKNLDTLISVTPKYHLMWKKEKDQLKPLFEGRLNRQFLSPIFEENGAFVISKVNILKNYKTRIYGNVNIYPLSEEEGIDIDNPMDFWLADSIIKQKKIGFVVCGNFLVGMGHVYRAITLYNSLCPPNKAYFFCNTSEEIAIKKLKSMNYPIVVYNDLDDLLISLKKLGIQIVINDILDTTYEYVTKLKNEGFFVVNFEDKGTGSKEAHVVINALYEWTGDRKNFYFGHKFECLREDIYIFPIKKKIRKKVKKIFVCFGGTDPSNITKRIINIFIKIKNFLLKEKISIDLILGFGYDKKREQEIREIIEKFQMYQFIRVLKDIQWIAPYIYDADIAIISNGRMVYEVVSMAIPLIVIGQNYRETLHTFSAIHPAIKYLGISSEISDEQIESAIIKMLTNFKLRMEINQQLQKEAKSIREGNKRVISLIIQKYEEFLEEKKL